MKDSLVWYRLIWHSLGIASLAIGLMFGLHWLFAQGLLTQAGGWILMIWTGLVIGGLWAGGEYRRARRQQRDRRAYEALSQDYQMVQRQYQEGQAQYQAMRQECDRLGQQLQAQRAKTKDNAEAILEDCLHLEQDNQTLRAEIKTLKQENWHLREYPPCPSSATNDRAAMPDIPDILEPSSPVIPVSRLTSISGKQAVRALEQLGFHVENQNGSHIKLQRTQTQTCIVPNHPEVNPVTLKQVLLQAQVSLEEFLAAV
ncbi:MAG: type II toxin-antitoxin system HicA family toxin [Spirulinaceae cyanobacterium]